jgi:hypothetical protein
MALAETRQVDLEVQRLMEDQARATERLLNTLRLWEDAE